jgi:hypothetical protein
VRRGRHQALPTTHGAGWGTVLMAQRKLTATGRGMDTRVIFYVEAYRDKVWITSYSCPSVCEAILESAQADGLMELINQTIREARSHRNGQPRE